MRIVAMISFVLVSIEWALSPFIALATLGFGIGIIPLTAAPLAWYLIFTLPYELVDRHAAMSARSSAPVSPANARGLGL